MLHSTFYAATGEHDLTSDDWPGLIKDRCYEALIFDCDGTLVESGNAHFEAFRFAALTQGFVMARSWYDTKTGLDRKSTLEAFAQEVTGHFDVPKAIDASIEAFIGNGSSVSAIAPTVDLMRRYAPTHPISVVTNAEKQVAEASLVAIGVLPLVDFLVTVSDGLPPKPAPDLFVLAAAKMDIPVDRILVFEDSPEGLRAGRAAGMDVIRLKAPH